MLRRLLIKKLIAAFICIISTVIIFCSCSRKIVYPSDETDDRILHVIKKAQASKIETAVEG